MDFNVFKSAVAKQFDRMRKHELFRTQVEKDNLWKTYLSSFPAGSNPIFKERTEHDCNCCKQFIRAVGNCVAVVDGTLESIWDVEIPSEPEYQVVADALSALVKSAPIDNLFLHFEGTAGTDKNFQELVDGIKTWTHFHINIPREYVVKGAEIASKLADPRAMHDVLLRSLNELTRDSIDTVLELIAQNSLYRGDEHKFAVTEFGKLKKKFDRLTTEADKDVFVWQSIKTVPGSVAKIRNTSIGTLLIDLSSGRELEDSVKAFESMVAPANYKRPTALITKGMIEKAKKTLEDLGLTSALERRYAKLQDITINNILFADRGAKKVINGDVFDELAAATSSKVTTKKLDKVEEVPIQKFLSDILPLAESIEVMFENSHSGNLVSLIAPTDPTAGNLFKWSNNFSWSYSGEMADSIKERVKAAGGSVVGDLCCRLAWDYTDDLDFHMYEPNNGHIYFSNRGRPSPSGGILDVDANGMDGIRKDPVENIFYSNRNKMYNGVYKLVVHNYNRRSTGVGFEVELEFDGQTYRIGYDKVVKSGENVEVAQIKLKNGKFELISSLPTSQSTRTVWNLPTQTFHKVNVVMMSPNYWDDQVGIGNKHYFFMLDGCLNDGTARGFFNEFLKEELSAHRKVFEVVGSKMKVQDSSEQLSGLGFSSTQKNALLCRVKGNFSRIIKIVF